MFMFMTSLMTEKFLSQNSLFPTTSVKFHLFNFVNLIISFRYCIQLAYFFLHDIFPLRTSTLFLNNSKCSDLLMTLRTISVIIVQLHKAAIMSAGAVSELKLLKFFMSSFTRFIRILYNPTI